MSAPGAVRTHRPDNVVRLSEWRAPSVDARRRPARAPLLAALGASAIVHGLALLFLHAPGMAPPPAPPEPLEVVLVQPPVALPASPKVERAAPAPEPRQAPRRPPKRAARPSPPPKPRDQAPAAAPAQTAPVMTAPRENSQAAALPPPAEPAQTQTQAPAPAVAVPGEGTPGSAGASGAAAPGPLSPPSFHATYLRNPAPRYPLIARRNGEQGTVTLRVRVTRTGEPGSVVLERSSGSAALDAAALATVKEWRFVPARRDGEAVEASVLVPIVFRLRDAP